MFKNEIGFVRIADLKHKMKCDNCGAIMKASNNDPNAYRCKNCGNTEYLGRIIRFINSLY